MERPRSFGLRWVKRLQKLCYKYLHCSAVRNLQSEVLPDRLPAQAGLMVGSLFVQKRSDWFANSSTLVRLFLRSEATMKIVRFVASFLREVNPSPAVLKI